MSKDWPTEEERQQDIARLAQNMADDYDASIVAKILEEPPPPAFTNLWRYDIRREGEAYVVMVATPDMAVGFVGGETMQYLILPIVDDSDGSKMSCSLVINRHRAFIASLRRGNPFMEKIKQLVAQLAEGMSQRDDEGLRSALAISETGMKSADENPFLQEFHTLMRDIILEEQARRANG